MSMLLRNHCLLSRQKNGRIYKDESESYLWFSGYHVKSVVKAILADIRGKVGRRRWPRLP